MPDPLASILKQLAMVPDGVNVALVIRHAEREDIPAGTFGHEVNLTLQRETRSAEDVWERTWQESGWR